MPAPSTAHPDRLEQVAPEQWHEAGAAAHATGHTFFDWLTAVDRTDAATDPGFDVVVRVLATGPDGIRGLRVTTRVADGSTLASLTDLYAGAAWHERETFEMFGIVFDGFRDHTGDADTGLGLRPLLLPDGFEGTPLRKSFQLAARASKAWPGGKEPGEGHDSVKSPSRRRVQAPGVPPPEWGPR
jgi:NADH-quinone oxidoreductase subunit C